MTHPRDPANPPAVTTPAPVELCAAAVPLVVPVARLEVPLVREVAIDPEPEADPDPEADIDIDIDAEPVTEADAELDTPLVIPEEEAEMVTDPEALLLTTPVTAAAFPPPMVWTALQL